MNLTGIKIKGYIVQCLGGVKALGNVSYLKYRNFRFTTHEKLPPSVQAARESSIHTVNGIFADCRRVFHSFVMLESVNKCAICIGRANGVRSSLPNLDESTRAYNFCD